MKAVTPARPDQPSAFFMKIADFELLVCRTSGLSPAAFVAGRIGEIVRKRAARLGCRTLDAYAYRIEDNPAELAALIRDATADLRTALPPAAPKPVPVAATAVTAHEPLSLAAARTDPRFRRRRNMVKVQPLAEPRAAPREAQRAPSDPFAGAKQTLAEHFKRTAPTPAALVLLGLIRDAEGSSSDAEACYRAALDRDPAHSDALCELAFLLARRGDAPAAKATAKRLHDLTVRKIA